MPLIRQTDTPGLDPFGTLPDAPEERDPSFLGETLPAAFRLENSIVSGAVTEPVSNRGLLFGDLRADPDFDPFGHIPDHFIEFAGSYIDAGDEADVHTITRQVERELEDRKTLEAAGGSGVAASFAAGLLDPVVLVPVGGPVVQAARAGSAVARAAIRSARGGFIGSSVAETALQGTQETRSALETGTNITAATLLSGMLGAGVAKLVNPARAIDGLADDLRPHKADPLDPGFVRLTEDDLASDTGRLANDDLDVTLPESPDGPDDVGAVSAGAAATRQTTLAEEKLKGALGVEKLPVNPLVRAVTSPSIETRRIAQDLVESPFQYEKNALGIASPVPVESLVKLYQAPLAEGLVELDNLFIKYRLGRARRFGDVAGVAARDMAAAAGERLGGTSRQNLSDREFREQVGRAMRRGDEHDIPEVAQAAKMLRQKIFEPLKQRAIENGQLPEDVDVTTAASYLTRVYDLDKITSRRREFADITVNWLKGQQARVEETVSQIQETVARAERELPEMEAKAEDLTVGVREVRAKLRVARERRAKLRGQAVEARRGERRAEREARAVRKRQKLFSREPDRADDGIGDALETLRRGRRPKPPQTLAQFLRANGGLRESRGELRAIGIDGKSTPGLLNNKSGANLDDAALRAWEEGFLPEYRDRPTISEFLEAVRDDIAGNAPRVREGEEAVLDEIAFLDELQRAVDDAGIDIRALGDADIVRRLEGTPGRDTKVSPERVRELEVSARRAARDSQEAAQGRIRAEEALEATEAEFRTLRGENQALGKALEDTRGAIKAAQERIDRGTARIDGERQFAFAEEQELADIADDIIDAILRHPGGRIPYEAIETPKARGPLKERTFGIPDEQIEDFLESDAALVARIYTNTLAPDVEIARRFGGADMKSAISRVEDDFRNKVRRAGSPAESKALQKRMGRDIRDLEAMRDRLRSVYMAPGDPNSPLRRVVRGIKDINYFRLMGGVTASSFPDIARTATVEGINRTFGSGLVPLVTNLRKFRIAAREANMAGTAWDMVNNSRAMALADIGDEFGRRSRVERAMSGGTGLFSLVNLMAPWNTALKQFAGVVTGSRILDVAGQVADGTARAADAERLAAAGVDSFMARKITEQFAKHGERDGGLLIARSDLWTDREALEVFRAALVRQVDATIVTPGVGDRPLMTDSSLLGQLAFQFKSFAFAAHNKMLVAGLQQRDAAVLNGLLLSVAAGMMTYAYKTWERGGDLSDDPRRWLAEGFDRSGVLGVFFEANSIVELASEGSVGVRQLTGGRELSRYAVRGGIAGKLLGPTAGLTEDFLNVTGAISKGAADRADVKSARRLLPAQNLVGLRILLDRVQQGAENQLVGP